MKVKDKTKLIFHYKVPLKAFYHVWKTLKANKKFILECVDFVSTNLQMCQGDYLLIEFVKKSKKRSLQ